MNKSIKKAITLILAFTLVLSLGVSAFADFSDKGKCPDKDNCPNKDITKPEIGFTMPDEDSENVNDKIEFDYDDLDEAFTFDMSEIFDQIKDSKQREKIEKLYEEYMAAFEEEQKAYDKLVDAEDAFFSALYDAEFEDDFSVDADEEDVISKDTEKDESTIDEQIEEIILDLDNMSDEDLSKIILEFMSWFNSVVKPMLESSSES